MRRWLSPKIMLLSVLGLAACATMLGQVRPKGRGTEIVHSHTAHKDIACEMCHDGMDEAATISQALLPREEKCLTCHSEHKENNNCGYCHQNTKKPGSYAPTESNITFSHKAHAQRKVPECATCHKDLSDSGRSLGRPPTMATCATCHSAQIDEGKCEKCHKDLHKFPLRPIAQFSHGGDYVRQHRLAARSGTEACAKCHDERFCSDCHGKTNRIRVEVKFAEDVDRDFIHRGDYVSRHAIEAKADPALCARCHGTSYCQACHALNSRSPGVLSPRSPHPAGYAGPGPTSHAVEARRNVANCASCHDQGARSNCITCHKVGGIGGNPHPASWDKQHSMDEARTRTVCLYCH